MNGFAESFAFYVLVGFCVGWVVSFLSSAIGTLLSGAKGNSVKWDL